LSKNFLLNPQAYDGSKDDEATRKIMASTIAFFEHKGLREMKIDDMLFRYSDDFVKCQRDLKAFATMLTPEGYGENPDTARYDLRRITHYNELLSFYNLATRYIFQVSILGSSPIWMSDNQTVKEYAAKLLREGHIFGFGCSEKEHGADLYNNEMTITTNEDGTYRADGEKYYIGNSDRGFIATFARFKENDDWAFFLTDSRHRCYNDKKNIKSSYLHTGYVGEYALVDYPVTADDIISRGKKAWNDALSTVNIGKFQVGVSPIGVATHAFYECLHHSYNRWLYGKRVTAMPHVREMFVQAYIRTVGMRLYAFRAIDYFKSCSATDRRYLLFNPVNKMKTALEGVTAITQLWDAVTARGFECETYMEQATRDIQSSPRLEGTAHVNMNLILKFIANYLFHHQQYEDVPVIGATDDSCIFRQSSGNLASVTFDDYRSVYEACQIPNVVIFYKQAVLLREYFEKWPAEKWEKNRIADMLSLGHMFTQIVYGQLILESAKLYEIDDIIINRLFYYFVKDMAHHSLEHTLSQELNPPQAFICREIAACRPEFSEEDYDLLWSETVEPLNDVFVMNN